ncbi:hypothetical protein D9M68_894580 [compost metagenome]
MVQQRRYTVVFDGDRLVKFGGDELPSEYELIAEIDGMKKALKDQTPGKVSTSSTAAAQAEPQTTVENFVPRQATEPAAAPAPAPAAPAAPAAEAPPAAAPAQATVPAEASKAN